jgi:outer membrane protein
MNASKLCLAVAVASAVVAPAVQAQVNVVKFGAVRYDPHTKTSGLSGIGIPPGADAKIEGATTLLFVYERLLGPNWGVELALGLPPRMKARATGSAAFLGEVISVRNVAPTVLVNYHFGSGADPIRPYAGIGINYTRFSSIRTSYAWDVSLSDSVGPAVNLGVELTVAKPWTFFASASYIKVKTDLVAVGASVLQTSIDVRPMVYAIGAAYRF